MRILLSILICIVLAQNAPAQSKGDKEVATCVAAFNKAMLDGNKDSLIAITAKALSYGHSNGKIEDRDAFVGALASGQSDFISLSTSGQTIKASGSIAVVRHRLEASIVDSGIAVHLNLAVMQVWEKEGKKWKLLARQACKL